MVHMCGITEKKKVVYAVFWVVTEKSKLRDE